MRREFTNTIAVPIGPGPPNTVASHIDVTGVGNATVDGVEVTVDIDHS